MSQTAPESQHTQNWRRIMAELELVIDQLEGPTGAMTWASVGPDAKTMFVDQVKQILGAQLGSRSGEERAVNVRISDILKYVGEQLAQATAGSQTDV